MRGFFFLAGLFGSSKPNSSIPPVLPSDSNALKVLPSYSSALKVLVSQAPKDGSCFQRKVAWGSGWQASDGLEEGPSKKGGPAQGKRKRSYFVKQIDNLQMASALALDMTI